MPLITDAQLNILQENGSVASTGRDHYPVLKLFTPDANADWLLSEIIAEDIAFGLCDLGMGFPELGYVSLSEFESFRGPTDLLLEVDEEFDGDYPLSAYAEAARIRQRIVAVEPDVQMALTSLRV
jgi:hypothetical protein